LIQKGKPCKVIHRTFQKKRIEQEIIDKENAALKYKLQVIEQESETKFKQYIENAPDGVFVFDQDRNYVEVNQAVCDLTGYSEQELLRMKFEIYLHLITLQVHYKIFSL
jgi:PAS domain-containing protein